MEVKSFSELYSEEIQENLANVSQVENYILNREPMVSDGAKVFYEDIKTSRLHTDNEILSFITTMKSAYLESANYIMVVTPIMDTVAEIGWSLPFDLMNDEIEKVRLLLVEDNVKEIDDLFIAHEKKILPVYKDKIIRACPIRAPFLNAAFQAGDRGEFELAVPVILIQLEGIFKDNKRHEFFGVMRADRMPKVINAFKDDGPLSKSFISHFRALGDPDKSNNLVPDRNRILHGEDLTYNNETVYYKVLSFLFMIIDHFYA